MSAAKASDAISAHLRDILASDAFSGAWRQRRLLEYLVSKSLEGRTDDLKEYCVGVEVFEKGDDFDPRLSPIVRVEVSRLRKRLEQYYNSRTTDDGIRIELPRGSYVPQIVEARTPAGPAPAPDLPTVRRYRWRLWAAGAVATAAAMLLVVKFAPTFSSAPDQGGYSFTRVTREQAQCNGPALAPDGSQVAYARHDSGDWNVYIRTLGRDETRNLTPDSPADDWQPAFSPDGAEVAFRSEREGGGIWTVPVRGGAARRLAPFGYHPSWSPDGARIVFSSKTFDSPEDGPRRRAGALYEVEVATGSVSRITGNAVYDAVQPACSPHGSRIAYWASDENGNRDLWTITRGGTARPVPVTRDEWVDWNPRWSPDGRYLYFVSDRDGAMNVWRIRIDEESGAVNGAPEPVRTPSSYSADINLSGDGKRIVYTNRQISTRIFRAPFDFILGVKQDVAVALTRPGERFREPRLSPDGKWFAVRIQDPQEDIGLMRPDGTGLRRLTNDQYKDRLPQWSPDGSYLTFLSNRGGTFESWVIRPDGNGLRRLGDSVSRVWWPDGSLVGYPADGKPFVLEPAGRPVPGPALPRGLVPDLWSPDGQKLIGRMRGASGQVTPVVYSVADGSEWSFAENAVAPLWLKDGSGFLFRQEGELRLTDVRTHRTRAILSVPGMHDRFALSHDEKSIFFVLSEAADTVWMAERR